MPLPVVTSDDLIHAAENTIDWLHGIAFELFIVGMVTVVIILVLLFWSHFYSEQVEGYREVNHDNRN